MWLQSKDFFSGGVSVLILLSLSLPKCKGDDDTESTTELLYSNLAEEDVLQNDVVFQAPCLPNVIRGLQKVVYYYSRQKQSVTVDFAFGMQVVLGKFHSMKSELLGHDIA